MPFLSWLGPIVVWELSRHGRQRQLFVLRTGYVAMLGFVAYTCYEATEHVGYWMPMRNPRHFDPLFVASFFNSFAVIQLLIALALTPGYVGSAIAQDKESGTLSLLLTTHLSAPEIVVGRWASRCVVALVPIFGGMGVMGVMQLFGGLRLDLLLAVTALCVSAVMLVAAVSMVASVYAAQTGDGLFRAYLWTLILFFGPFLLFCALSFGLYAITKNFDWLRVLRMNPSDHVASEVFWLVASINPMFVLVSTMGYDASLFRMWQGIVVEALVAALCLMWATRQLRRRVFGSPRVFSESRPRRRRRIPPLGPRANPMRWKERILGPIGGRRRRRIRLLAFFFVGVWIAVFLAVAFRAQSNWGIADRKWFRNDCAGVAGMMTFVGFIIALLQASMSVTAERRRQTWVSMLATPIDSRDLLGAKRDAVAWEGAILLSVSTGPLAGLAYWFGELTLAALPMALVIGWVMSRFFASLGVLISVVCQQTGQNIVAALVAYAILSGGFQLLVVAIPASLLNLRTPPPIPLSPSDFAIGFVSMLPMDSLPWGMFMHAFSFSELHSVPSVISIPAWASLILCLVGYHWAGRWCFNRACRALDRTERIADGQPIGPLASTSLH